MKILLLCMLFWTAAFPPFCQAEQVDEIEQVLEKTDQLADQGK